MTYSNIATKKVLSGIRSHGPNIGLGEGFPYLKYAWELYVRDTDGKGNMLITLPPLIAKTVELPRWSTDTQIINVYNHKTIVQTKFNWEPITISFYDQVNKSAECLIWHFVKAQFDAPDGSKAPKHKDLDLEIRMRNLSGPGAKDKVYKLKKAYIVDAQHDTLDYSTSDVVLWTVTIRYEELEFEDCDFKGPAPTAATGMARIPRPTPQRREDRRTTTSNFTPQRRPQQVPPDARAETEPNRWVEAGGLETAGGAAIGNPSLLRQGERARRNREEQERLRREREAQNPPGPSIGERVRNFFTWPSRNQNNVPSGAGSSMEMEGFGAPSIPPGATSSPSTGPNVRPTTNAQPQRSLTSAQRTVIENERESMRNAEFNPAWKEAYLRNLEQNPPVTGSAQSAAAARRVAELRASAEHPRYPSQVRTTRPSGTEVNSFREPAPQPVRNGSETLRSRSSDVRGNEAAERQQRLEQRVRSGESFQSSLSDGTPVRVNMRRPGDPFGGF